MNLSAGDIIRIIGLIAFVVIPAMQSIARSRKKSLEEAELNRQLTELEAARREANPQTQSYQGYLQRTRQETLENDSVPDALGRHARPVAPVQSSQQNTFLGDIANANGEQTRLRRELARKMTGPATASNKPIPAITSFQDLLRQLSETETTQLPKQAPASNQAQATKQAPRTTAQYKPQQSTTTARTPKRIEDPRALQVTTTQVVPEKPKTAKTKTQIANPNALIQFGRNDLVRGIVLSEVLGPPKSRRHR